MPFRSSPFSSAFTTNVTTSAAVRVGGVGFADGVGVGDASRVAVGLGAWTTSLSAVPSSPPVAMTTVSVTASATATATTPRNGPFTFQGRFQTALSHPTLPYLASPSCRDCAPGLCGRQLTALLSSNIPLSRAATRALHLSRPLPYARGVMRTPSPLRRPAPHPRSTVCVVFSYLMALIVRPAPIPERRSITQTYARRAPSGYAAPQREKNDVPVNQIGNLRTPTLSKIR